MNFCYVLLITQSEILVNIFSCIVIIQANAFLRYNCTKGKRPIRCQDNMNRTNFHWEVEINLTVGQLICQIYDM